MKLFLVLMLILCPQAFADVNQETSFDLGIGFAPSFTPEAGYSQSRLRLGIEGGVTFFKYEDSSWVNIKGVSSTPQPTLKFIRVGVAAVANQPVLIFSPLSVKVRERAYLSPTIGFGKDPYTLFSFSYELLP